MKKLMSVLFALLALIMVSSSAQAHFCKKVFYCEPYPNCETHWWIPNHYTPCGYFVPGHWSSCVVGYKISRHQVYVPGHYSKSIGWVPASVRPYN